MHRPDSSARASVAGGGVPLFAASAVGSAFSGLPASFYTRVAPRPLTDPWLVHANPGAADLLGLDAAAVRTPEFLALCAGSGRLPGIDPVATVYSGHQFGVWAGQLGDGRAHLLGDVRGPQGRWEIQLKGSGRTPYSRMGDGWAVLRSSVREYLASQAMVGLGIPTTQALALTASRDPVIRETPETAAVVTRLAPSFVRFGHFEHWAHSATEQAALLDYVVADGFQDCRVGPADHPDRPATACRLLEEVVRRTARLMAQWQLAGFCHGVMNTDNMSILGLTLDYGPYGFMDAFQANHVCNHSDTLGRYAWNAQPAVAQWNLTRLAESLLVLGCTVPDLEAALAPFERTFLQAYHAGLARKFGLADWRPEDAELGDAWWTLLHAQRADFTLAFRRLADVGADAQPWLDLFADTGAAGQWLERYRTRLAQDPRPQAERKAAMDRVNPLYVLRNHLAQQAIEAAQQGDGSVVGRLMDVLQDPYTERPGRDADAQPPVADAPTIAVSCSS
ncbi:protein adenylyltransferase SelO [Castellaniella sp.]|uniref:protein adenylyltransferase SelO n=1 Tax=Castellaniella sp. TaxID=1955812 RepID=UPI003C7462E5